MECVEHWNVKAIFHDRNLNTKNLGFSSYGCLGWSDGGITAQIMAAQYPSVEKLVIWGSNAYVGDEDVKLYKSNNNC